MFGELARKLQSMIKNDFDKFSGPGLSQIKEYDRYCRSCKNCLLLAVNDKCIICHSNKLMAILNPSNKSEFVYRGYYYVCTKCNTSYYSYKKLTK